VTASSPCPPPTGARARGAWVGTLLVGLVLVAGAPAHAESPPAPDRTIVVIPPAYPAPTAGFLRLPDTTSTPIPAPPPAASVAPPQLLLPDRGLTVPLLPVPQSERPVWTPSRLEPVQGLDGRGRPTTILEYTPGRFSR
jgi:hypothetical protein